MEIPFFTSIGSATSGQTLFLALIGLGTFLAVMGAVLALSKKSVAAQRMLPKQRRRLLAAPSLADIDESAPSRFAAVLIPKNEDEQRQVALALARAGYLGHNSVVRYYLVRLALGLGLPLIFSGALFLSRTPDAPGWLESYMGGMTSLRAAQHIAILCGIGFFGPDYWLKSRMKKRKQAIEEAFPNVLDLLQVGVEAGMGFDQALLKVATEVQTVAPELAEEILVLLSEIQAGRDRDRALMRMARRTGVDEMVSFVNVVMQSARFGTSMSDALTTYAEEMRTAREMKAEEKANQLPVQMSAVMALLMLPAIISLVLAPIVIRYMNTFG